MRSMWYTEGILDEAGSMDCEKTMDGFTVLACFQE